MISSTTCGSPARIFRMNLAFTNTSTSNCAPSFSSLTSQYRLVSAAATAEGNSGARAGFAVDADTAPAGRST